MSDENEDQLDIPPCEHPVQQPDPSTWGPIITIHVGRPNMDEEIFQIHKGLLTHHLEYFRAALRTIPGPNPLNIGNTTTAAPSAPAAAGADSQPNNNSIIGNGPRPQTPIPTDTPIWLEGSTNTIRLPHDDPKIFGIFTTFLYTGKLYTSTTPNQNQNPNPNPNPPATTTTSNPPPNKIPLTPSQIIHTHIFALTRLCPSLQNVSPSLLFAKISQDWTTPIEDLHFIYTSTPPGASIRKLLVDEVMCVYKLKHLENPRRREKVPHEMLCEILVEAGRRGFGFGERPKRNVWVWVEGWKGRFCRELHGLE